jgi:hypothetical protein
MISPNLSKGATMEKIFMMSRSDPNEDLFFTVTTEGATKDWITIDQGKTFVMPKGQQRFPIVVIAKIPLDAANGHYEGGIRIVSSTGSAKAINGSGSSVVLASLIQTDFTVTGKQILEYEVTAIKVQNIEEGSPLEVMMTINNTGNVTARPTKVHVELYDKFNSALLESSDISEMGSVKPFEVGNIVIPIATKLGLDQYWAKISAYNNETILREDSMVFEIVGVGNLNKSGNLKDVIYEKRVGVGEITKITGIFENTGQTNYSAKLVAEVFRNGKLQKVIEGDLINVEQGKTENFNIYFTPDESGEYIIKAHVVYSGGKTAEKEIKISAGGSLIGGVIMSGLISSKTVLVVVVLFILVLIWVIKKKRG